MNNLFIEQLLSEMKRPKPHADENQEEGLSELSAEQGESDEGYDKVEALVDIERVFQKYLTPNEAAVMEYRWLQGYTTPQVAEAMGTTTKTIQRLEESAFSKLVKMLETPTLHQTLWRILMLTAVVEAPNQVERFAEMAQADKTAVMLITKASAKQQITALRKAGY